MVCYNIRIKKALTFQKLEAMNDEVIYRAKYTKDNCVKLSASKCHVYGLTTTQVTCRKCMQSKITTQWMTMWFLSIE